MNGVGQARNLRNNMTDAERALWEGLRTRQVESCKFRRQCPIGPYIVDFVCLERMLVVEVDGGQHAIRQEEDERRTAWLRRNGYTVLRFWNHEVLRQREAVLEAIRLALVEAKASKKEGVFPSPPSPREGLGEGELKKVTAVHSDRPHPNLPPQGEGAGRPQPQWAYEKAAAPAITSPLPTGGGQGEGESNKVAAAYLDHPHPNVHAGHSLSGTLRAASPCTNPPGADWDARSAGRSPSRMEAASKPAFLPVCPPQGEGAEAPALGLANKGGRKTEKHGNWESAPEGDP